MSAYYDMHSFCTSCGKHRQRMSFGTQSSFFDREPCRHCGEPGSGVQVIAARKPIGRWPWQRAWVDREGDTVDAVGARPQRWS